MITPFASSQLFRMPSGSERINYIVPPPDHVRTRMGVEDRLEKIKQFRSLYFASGVVKLNPLYSNEHITAMEYQRFTVSPPAGREYYNAGRASVHHNNDPCHLSYSVQIPYTIDDR